MKAILRLTDRIPIVGYLARLLAGLLRLPDRFASYDGQLAEIHARLARQSRQLEVMDEFAKRLHAGITELQHRVGEVSLASDRSGANAARELAELRNGFDRHVPTLLNLSASMQSTARLLRREISTAKAGSRDSLEQVQRELQAGIASQSAMKSELEARVERSAKEFAAAQASVQSSVAAVRDMAGATAAGQSKLTEEIGRLAALAPATQTVDALKGNVEYLLGRVEFVRRELLFELRYGTDHVSGPGVEAPTRIVNKKKVDAARSKALRLNVGCGHLPMDGFVNVDIRELPGVDVIAEASRMPFSPGEATEIFSAHLLEHFPQEELRRNVLPAWRKLLKPGGVLRAVVPDTDMMINEYAKGNYRYDSLREVMYGSQDYSGDFHFNMFTADSLKGLFEEAGLKDYEVHETGRRNGECYEMEVSARAP